MHSAYGPQSLGAKVSCLWQFFFEMFSLGSLGHTLFCIMFRDAQVLLASALRREWKLGNLSVQLLILKNDPGPMAVKTPAISSNSISSNRWSCLSSVVQLPCLKGGPVFIDHLRVLHVSSQCCRCALVIPACEGCIFVKEIPFISHHSFFPEVYRNMIKHVNVIKCTQSKTLKNAQTDTRA